MLCPALASSACRERARPAEDGLAQACKAACAPLSESGCFAGQDPADAQRACARACEDSGRESRLAGCTRQHYAFLTCVAERARGCSGAKTPRGALDVELALADCAEEARAYRACVAVCGERGVVHTRSARLGAGGALREIHAETVGRGCAPDPTPPSSRAPAGSACTHHSVCSAVECTCPSGRARFHARVCADGRCADRALACRLAPEAVGNDPCGPGDGP